MYCRAAEHPERMRLVEEPFNRFDLHKGLNTLKEQYNEFKTNQDQYIIDFLKGKYKIFESVDKIDFDSLMNRDYIDSQIFEKYKSVFKKAAINNRKANRIKAFPSLKRLFYGTFRFLTKLDIDEIKFIANYWFLLRPIEEMKKQSHLYEWQCNSSSQTQ